MENLNIVYVIVSNGNDLFYKQLLISILSLRYRMGNNVNITLLTEKHTEKALNKSRIWKLVDCINVQELDDKYSPGAKSRILKTIMRNVVEGDFLYIDCDTVVCESLEEIKLLNNSCAVLDNHQPVCSQIKEFELCIKNAKKMNFSVGFEEKHMNSGVIWCKDDEETRSFFETWHNLWLEGYKQGIYIDQLSFNEVNNRMNGVIREIDGRWNCQLRYGVPFLGNAKIIHYFASNMNSGRKFGYILTDKEFWEKMNVKSESIKEIDNIIKNPKSAFYPSMIIETSSENYKIINSNIGALHRELIRKFPKIFNMLDNALGKFRKRE